MMMTMVWMTSIDEPNDDAKWCMLHHRNKGKARMRSCEHRQQKRNENKKLKIDVIDRVDTLHHCSLSVAYAEQKPCSRTIPQPMPGNIELVV